MSRELVFGRENLLAGTSCAASGLASVVVVGVFCRRRYGADVIVVAVFATWPVQLVVAVFGRGRN